MTPEEENQLIDSIKKDPSMFGVVFDLHYPVIFDYLFRRLADFDLARDMASETFLKAFLKAPSFNWKGIPMLFWLYRIANNEIKQYYRNKKFRPQSLNLLIEAKWDMTDPKTTDEEKLQLEKGLQGHKDFLYVQNKITLLAVIYQEVIALRYFEHKAIKEIAVILGKKEGTIKSLLSRGCQKLKKLL